MSLSAFLRRWFGAGQDTAPSAARGYGFAAAETSRLTAALVSETTFINTTLRWQLRTLRARSRQAAQNKPYARRFVQMVVDNVAGAQPFRLQAKVRFGNGRLDSAANRRIEEAWRAWGRKGSCEITRQHGWTSLMRTVVRTWATDGEVILRVLTGPEYPGGLRLQLIDTDRLDEQKNESLPGGGAVHMGVEVNAEAVPVAYHLLRRKPSQWQTGFSREYERVPAEQILHLFVPESPEQIRGVPWLYAALLNLVHLGAFEEAAVIAADVGASQMGIIQSPDGEPPTMDSRAKDGTPQIDAEPGAFPVLPPGYEISAWNPRYPDAAVGPFLKACLRGIASGLGVAYHNLASDLEGVNYSSARIGELDERETWLSLQQHAIEHLLDPLYRLWLRQSVMAQVLPFAFDRLPQYESVYWQCKRWAWVDPEKEINAAVIAIENRLKSRTRVVAEQGEDLEDVYSEIAAENQLAEDMGLDDEEDDAEDEPSAAGSQDDEEEDMQTETEASQKADRKVIALPQKREANIEAKQRRAMECERGAIDTEARTVELSFSSEQPYERYWGTEILDHGPDAVDLSRLNTAHPLLLGHDPDRQIGVVERAWIGPDRKGRAMVRFSRSDLGEEIFRDVQDGIRRLISVGYRINDMALEFSQGAQNTYRVTSWTPHEISVVSVPADASVGIGRGLVPPSTKETAMTEAITGAPAAESTVAAKPATPQVPSADEIRAQEQSRIDALLRAGEAHADIGGAAMARELIRDPSATVETLKLRLFEAQRGKSKPLATAAPADLPPAASYGEAPRMRFRYGKLNAFTRDQHMGDGQVLRAEEAAYRAGMWMAAAIHGKSWAKRWLADRGFELFERHGNEVRVMSAGTLAGGGALVPVEMEQAVIDLRDEYGIARRLVRVRPMGSDTLQIPRRAGGLTAYFFADDDGVGITASDKSWSQVQLTAKKLGVLARVSEDLVEDAVISVVDDLATEMAYAFAQKEDNCLISGDGTSTYGGIIGLDALFLATAYASRITTTSGHDTMAEIDNTDLVTTQAGCAQFALSGAVWLCSSEFKATVFDRLKAAAGGNTVVTLGGRPMDAYLGYPILTSQAMPTDTTTDFTSKNMAFFGRFDMAASMGNRRGIEVRVLPEKYSEYGQIGVRATERFDLVVHDLGTTTVKGPVASMYGNS